MPCMVLWLATLIVLSSFSSPGWAQEKTVALEVDLLINGTGAEPLKDAVILIEGKRVKSVRKKGAVSIPKGARVITVKGGTALPGLIDSHVHYRDWQGELYLNHGVTTAFRHRQPSDRMDHRAERWNRQRPDRRPEDICRGTSSQWSGAR